MTNYIAWLLGEEPEEETAEAPAFRMPQTVLPRSTRGADTQNETDEETKGDSQALRRESSALRARAKMALPLPEVQRQGGGGADDFSAMPTEGVRPEFALSASTRSGDLLAALQREKTARGDVLHARFAEGRRRASFAQHPPQERSVRLTEPVRLSGGGLGFDPLELDRCFERDARRYDNGLTY